MLKEYETVFDVVQSSNDIAGLQQATEALRDRLETPISDLDLSVRAANCMEVEGITTLADLCGRTEESLLAIRNFGKTSLKEISKKLDERGLSLGMDVPSIMGEG